MALTQEQIKDLDAGIRDIVVRLNEIGFCTTDSGDGSAEGALPCRHVFMTVPPDKMVAEAHRLQEELAEASDYWRIETSYSPADGVAVLSMIDIFDEPTHSIASSCAGNFV